MGKRVYTEEQNAFLKRHPILDRFILTALFNKEFNENKKVEVIRSQCRRLGLRTVNVTRWGMGQKQGFRWEKGKIPEHLKATAFKKGHTFASKPIGHSVHKHGGFYKIKVSDDSKISRRNFRPKHRYLYEQHHGVKLNRWDVILFRDGNKENFDISNLVKASHGAAMYLYKEKLHTVHTDLKETVINLAELHVCAKKIRNSKRGLIRGTRESTVD